MWSVRCIRSVVMRRNTWPVYAVMMMTIASIVVSSSIVSKYVQDV